MWIMNPLIDKETQDHLVEYINKAHANNVFVWKEESQEVIENDN